MGKKEECGGAYDMKMRAYAKLNLALDIKGVREDGMHDLDMLMQNVSLPDELTIKRADRTEIRFGNMAVSADNTIRRAALLFFEMLQIKGGVQVFAEKKIPVQAGLGGGSADAAATLVALNELYDTGLKKAELQEMGLKIGADVPFFIGGGCMRARGVGDILEPVKNSCKFHYLLIKPKQGVSTPLAYQKYDENKPGQFDVSAVADSLIQGDSQRYFASAGNALQEAGIALCPEIGGILDQCDKQGAEFSMMTGSGSCVFAIFEEEEARQRAYLKLRKEYPFCVTAEDVGRSVDIL